MAADGRAVECTGFAADAARVKPEKPRACTYYRMSPARKREVRQQHEASMDTCGYTAEVVPATIITKGGEKT